MPVPSVELIPAYITIIILSPTLIWVGSKISLKTRNKDIMSKEQVGRLPVIASIALFGLFASFKYLKFDPSILLAFAFLFLSLISLSEMTTFFFSLISGGTLKEPVETIKIHSIPFLKSIIPGDIKLYPAAAIGFFVSVLVCMCYWFTKHWIFNNIIAIAIILQALGSISIGNFTNGSIALIGLFIYDIFWVFKTSVMVDVATKLAPIAPVLLKIPYSLDVTAESRFAMLGLGDIVYPGLVIALLCRFDNRLQKQNGTGTGTGSKTPTQAQTTVTASGTASQLKNTGSPYFFWSLVAYTVALCTAMSAMLIYNHPQPALLYLSPTGILVPLLLALFRDEMKLLWSYDETPVPEVSTTQTTDETPKAKTD